MQTRKTHGTTNRNHSAVAGGLSAASFYVPSYEIKKWSWETYWITLGFVAWIIMPTVGGLLTTPDLWGISAQAPSAAWSGLTSSALSGASAG